MAQPWKVKVFIQENTSDGEETSMSFYIGSVISTIASLETACQSVIEDVQAIITGTVTRVQVSFPIDISGWTLAPSDGTDTDRLESARLVMRNADNNRAQLNFPTFDRAKVLAGSKNVDQTDGDVVALLASLQGTTLATNQDNEVNTVDSFYRTLGGKK